MFRRTHKPHVFAPFFGTLLIVAIMVILYALLKAVALLCVLVLICLIVRKVFAKSKSTAEKPASYSPRNPFSAGFAPSGRKESWTQAMIYEQIAKIDWYQFEKLNAALMEAEGYFVTRKGGAQPDGGVDIVAESKRDGTRTLVQCKHWVAWNVDVPTVRELLGAMTHYHARKGQIRTYWGWTAPAMAFAVEHDITVADGHALARDARRLFNDATLSELLNPADKHCPVCDGPMVPGTGDLAAGAWACRRAPQCRGAIRSVAGVASDRSR